MKRVDYETLLRVAERFHRELSALGMEPQITTLTSTPGAGDDYKLTFQYLGPLFEPAEPVKAANHGPT